MSEEINNLKSNKEICRRDVAIYLLLASIGGAALTKSKDAKADLIPDIWDIIAEYIMPIVEAAYGEIYTPIIDGIKGYTDVITELYDPEKSAEQSKLAVAIGKKADALITARTFNYNQMILDATRQLHTTCADPIIAEQTKKIESTLEEAVRETVHAKNKPILTTEDYSSAVKLRHRYAQQAFDLNGIGAPDYCAASLLSFSGFKSDKSKSEALRYIENLIGLDYQFVKYQTKLNELSNPAQLNLTTEIAKVQFEKNTVSDELYTIYYSRVRSKGLLNKVSSSLSEHEYDILKPFANSLGMSQLDLQNFEVARFSAGLIRIQKLLGDAGTDSPKNSGNPTRAPAPTVTGILKEISKALALKELILSRVKKQEMAISKLFAMELDNGKN